MTTRAALGVWTLTLAVAAAAVAIIVTSDHTADKAATIALAVPIALVFVLSGLIARSRRPDNRTGSLLVAAGLTWPAGALYSANSDVLFTAGMLLGTLFSGVLAHLLLAFPTGRLERTFDRRLIAGGYALVLGGPLLVALFRPHPAGCDGPCPDNLVAITDAPRLADRIQLVYLLVAVALLAVLVARLVRRWRTATPALRRALSPVYAAGVVCISALLFVTALTVVSDELVERIDWLTLAGLFVVPFSFLYGLLRSRFGTGTRRLVAELSRARTPEDVQEVLRNALRDDSLELGYRVGDAYVDVHGHPFRPPNRPDRCVTPIGRQIIVHDAVLRDQPELADAVDAAQIALERGLSLRTLEETERRASALLEAVPDNVYRLSRDGVFLEAHASKQSAIYPPGIVYPGVPEAAVVGQRVHELMPEIAEHIMRGVELALEHGSGTVEFPIETPAGTRELELRTARSGPDEAVGIVRDFTDRRRQERQLRRVLDEQAALRRLATLAASSAETEPDRVFAAVTEEVGRLFEAQSATTSRFRENGATVVGSWTAEGHDPIGPGTDIPLDSDTPLVHVFRTGEPARIDGYDDLPGELAARLRRAGWTGAVTAPVYVSGRLWGAITAARTTGEAFPEATERRLVEFGEIVGIAIANAEARESLRSIAAEQAALTRVALAVAMSSQPEEIFDTVSAEVGQLLAADAANLVRFGGDDGGVIVGKWAASPEIGIADAGTSVILDGGPLTRARQTGHPVRGHATDPDVSPHLAERLRDLGVTSMVAAPIAVAGEPWGAVVVSVTHDRPFPDDAEARVEAFARLVAVAVANAEARESLATMAAEQAALSRVAVAVATEETPDRVFDVVTEEVARLVGAHAGSTVRYVDEDAVVVVGNWAISDDYELQKGESFPLRGGAITRVRETGLPARTDYRLRGGAEREMVAAPIVVSGKLWGAATVSIAAPDRFPPDVEARLGAFTRLVATALANAEAHEELKASRARIVQAGDAERRRLERNLHDGAQQRLVALALTLRLAQSRIRDDPEAANELLMQASDDLALGLEELRELARGIHPAILSDRGLVPALEALADRAAVPVRVDGLPDERLPEPIEAAAFYVVAESLTNVAKYAAATEARVGVSRDNGVVVVEVADDGVGGADASKGSGLRGLADRVEALGGRLAVASEPGQGTTVRAELPVDETV